MKNKHVNNYPFMNTKHANTKLDTIKLLYKISDMKIGHKST